MIDKAANVFCMTQWMGFDSGGTEQLWEPEVLLDMLHIVKQHEPFSRGDPNSPIFDDLEQQHPNITWREFRRDSSFNPIFRRSNPLVKLGLTTPEARSATVTALGEDVLSGIHGIQELYAIAARNIEDENGDPTMGRMCSAALENPNEEFDEVDIEYGISKYYIPGKTKTNDVLVEVRKKLLRVSSNTRKRRLRAFMNGLVNSGAFVATLSGWRLDNADIAKSISQVSTPYIHGKVRGNLSSDKSNRTQVLSFPKVVTEGRGAAPFNLSRVGKSDPVETALNLERSSLLHEELVGKLGKYLQDLGFEAFEDPNSFDVAIFEGSPSLFEVKTITPKNLVSQLRKAIVQLEEYRWRHLDRFNGQPKLFAVLNINPTPYIEPEYIKFIEEDRKIHLIWQGEDFVDQSNQVLQDILAHQL